MFTAAQIADHPFPDILINNNEAEAKVAAAQREKKRQEKEMRHRLRHRIDGWTAERQRVFLAALADTGCVSIAAEAADITPRSCYRLRRHPAAAAFARAWEEALLIATGRLAAIAFERAIVGTPREVWRGGKLIAETSDPSDKMMMFLLQHLLPRTYGQRGPGDGSVETRIEQARVSMPETLAALADIDEESPEALMEEDYEPLPPRDEGA